MAFLRLIILFVGVHLSATYARHVQVEGRVIGGVSVPIEEFPYQVSIRRTAYLGATEYHYCGGSIISPDWILTAGHCSSGLEARHLRVYAGSSDRLHGGTLHNVSQIIAHPQYYISADGIPFNDIGVMKVATPFVFGAKVAAVKLPTEATDAEVITGTMANATGWGATKVNGAAVASLLGVSVPIVSQQDCKRIYNRSRTIARTMLCAGYETGGKGVCQGDSGGPLVVKGVEVGIVSWGILCDEENYPGVYTNVSSFRKWIALETQV